MQGSPVELIFRDSPSALATAAKGAVTARVAVRIRAIRSMRLGKTVPEAAQEHGISPRALLNWVHHYNHGGLTGLNDRPIPGKPPKLAIEQHDSFKQRVLAGPSPEEGMAAYRGHDCQRILKEEYGVELCESAVYFFLHRIGLSSIMPRPRHRKADPIAQEAFKKTSRLRLKRSAKPIRTNGSRFGARMKRGSGNKVR